MLTRVLTLGVAAAAALGVAADAFASARCHMVASITAQQETPPSPGVNGFGCGQFVIDTAANTVTYHIAYSGLTGPETAAHIHGFAPPGVPAAAIHPLPLGNVKNGVWNYAEAQEAAILDGRCYVNIHTPAFPAGEIRGQITTHAAELDAQQETPPIVGLGSRGWAVLNLNKCTNTLSYHIVINSLASPENNAHIHGIALHGNPAGVLHPLPLGSPKIGTWVYPEALEEAIEDGLTYINIHTVVNGAGEIRGQISASLAVSDGRQETPPNASTGCGCAFLSLDRAGGRLGFDARHFGLVSPENNAHIHGFAPPAVPAGVLFPLPAGTPKRGVWTFGVANLLAMLDQRTYFNVHTIAFGGGEIRGQITLQRDCLQPGDADYDEDVDFNDITTELANFGNVYGLPAYNPINQGDSDYNGIVDFADFTTTLANFGRCYQ